MASSAFPGRPHPWRSLATSLLPLATTISATLAANADVLRTGAVSSFLENAGQLDPSVLYYCPSPEFDIYLLRDAVVLDFGVPAGAGAVTGHGRVARIEALCGAHDVAGRSGANKGVDRCAVWMRMRNPGPLTRIETGPALATQFHFLLGRDPSHWQREVHAFTEVIYREVWPGIDLVFTVDQGRLCYEVAAAPGADLGVVDFTLEGAEQRMSPGSDPAAHGGELVELYTSLGSLWHDPPGAERAYGVIGRGAPTPAWCPPHRDEEERLLYSTYLGGSHNEYGNAIALDVASCPIVVGETSSLDLPTTIGAYQSSHGGSWYDAFVAKLDATGSNLLWCTYVGGDSLDLAEVVRLDPAGNIIVAGSTESRNFPVTTGAYSQTHNGGLWDVCLFSLDPTGSLLQWSTYLGASASEFSGGLQINEAGDVLVGGDTTSPDFPATPGAFDEEYNDIYGEEDAFLARLSADGSTLQWATYLGGEGPDRMGILALDSQGNPVVTGMTGSFGFPTSAGAFQGSLNSSYDGFVAKITADGAELLLGTYLGGSSMELPFGIVVDAADEIVVAGITQSSDFPTTAGAFDETPNGALDAFVTKLTANGNELVWSTFLGGTVDDIAYGLALDASGAVLICGGTTSPDFPTTAGAYDQTFNHGIDVTVAQINSSGTALLWSSYLGADADTLSQEECHSFALDRSGDVVLTGYTTSEAFPVTPGAYDNTNDGLRDVFISRLDLPGFGGDPQNPPWHPGNLFSIIIGIILRILGFLDLFVSHGVGEPNALFEGNGAGTFTNATNPPLDDLGDGRGSALADYDNDGDLDIYLANHDGPNHLYRNDGNGVFVDATTAPLNDPGLGFGVAWADYDNDGLVDLYLANYSGPNRLFHNEGSGVFTNAASGPMGYAGSTTMGVWSDYDGDGDQDLYLCNFGSANMLLRNDGGTFTNVTASSGPVGIDSGSMGAAFADYDNDGWLDLYVTNMDGPDRLFHNEGNGTFSDASQGLPPDELGSRGLAWADYDNDGDLDLYVTNNGPNWMLRNEGGGAFVDAATGELGDAGEGTAAAWGDFNLDGLQDLYFGNFGGTSKLLLNGLGGDHHWIQINLYGGSSNAAAIGARVRVVAGGTAQIREISGGSGFCSQNSLTAALGLGQATVVDSLQVFWPGGDMDLITQVAVDQFVEVHQGGADVPEPAAALPFRLHQARPNPASGAVHLEFELPEAHPVDLGVFDAGGRRVRTLASGPRDPGRHVISWDGRDQVGRPVAGGCYFCRLQAGRFAAARKVMLPGGR